MRKNWIKNINNQTERGIDTNQFLFPFERTTYLLFAAATKRNGHVFFRVDS